MGFNSPVPVKLPDECRKAAKILTSFLDGSNNGLDKVIPRHVMEHAKGFAIFTVVAGFLVSARAGSGVCIAKLPDGNWSAPSAIGTAGLGFGGQAGAEVTDFLIVLNSRSAVASFMAAGSLSLGGNMSLAVGPVGRNAEGSGTLSSKGKVAAMYSYSKTKGLFGGVSLEGSVIVERQDANRIAYGSAVTAKQLLSGVVPVPVFADVLVQKIVAATGLPGGQTWINDSPLHSPALDEFGGDRYGGGGSPSGLGPGGAGSYGFPGIGSASPATGRSRSGSLLSGRKRGDSVSSVKAAGRDSPVKTGSPKPGLFQSMSFRGRGSSKGQADYPDGLATTSEAYNNRIDNDRDRRASTYTPSSEKYNGNGNGNGFIASPAPQRARTSSTATPTFATHFESNLSTEDVGNNGNGSSNDLMSWDDAPPSSASRSEDLPTAPRFSSSSTDPARDSFSSDNDGHHFSSSSYPINSPPQPTYTAYSSNPNNDYLANTSRSSTPKKKPSRPLSSFLPRSSSFRNDSNNSPAPPSPSFRREDEPPLQAEEDWGTLGEKARMGISRTRSGSGSQLLATGLGPGGSSKLDRTEEAIERGEDVGGEYKDVQGVVARGVAVFEFKGVEAGDLSFQRGDVILITKKTDKKADWWTGQVGYGPQGVFPGNYIEVVRR